MGFSRDFFLVSVSCLTVALIATSSTLALADDSLDALSAQSVDRSIAQAPITPTKKKKKSAKKAKYPARTKVSFDDQAKAAKPVVHATPTPRPAVKVMVAPHIARPTPPPVSRQRPVPPPSAVVEGVEPLSKPMVTATPPPVDDMKFPAPQLGPFKLTAWVKEVMDLGTAAELQTVGGKNYTLFSSVMLGIIHDSGFGVKGVVTWKDDSFDDQTKSKRDDADVQAYITHPTLYKEGDVALTGLFRLYFPTTEASKKVNKHRYVYYSILDVDLPKPFQLENTFTFKYTYQDTYADADGLYLYDDELDLNTALAPWLNLGLGIDATAQQHYADATIGVGTAVVFTPYLDFSFSNFFLEARYFTAMYTNGQIDGPQPSPSLDNSYAELVLMASF